MLLWAKGGVSDDPKSLFDGSIESLITIYETHKRSPFKAVRYKTQLSYASNLRSLKVAVGKTQVKNLAWEDFLDWQEQFGIDDDGSEKPGRAVGLMGHLKRVFRFGALVLPRSAGCHDICDIFDRIAEIRSGMLETSSRKRTEYITVAQCRLLMAEAHRRGRHSVALVQAMAFDCGLRPKDVYGEWIPVGWPGTSDVVRGGYKWLMGARWDEIDANLIWRHRLSKSVRGNKAVARPDKGKIAEFDLKSFGMVMEELQSIPPERRVGPVVINEFTGYPWNDKQFQGVWRDIARACGIPDNVQNRDSRAGAATEADLAGVPREKVKRMLGHSKEDTTAIYQRADREVRTEIAQLRAENRKKTQ
jgi:integrase